MSPSPDSGPSADHYEYERHELTEEARKYAARRPPYPQSDYFIVTLADAVDHMWNVMQRACNHPERWNEILTEELDSWRPTQEQAIEKQRREHA